MLSGPMFDPAEDLHRKSVYGNYGDELTFLVVQPRLVGMTHGNVKVTLDDIPFLKKLRASTWKASRTIGKFEKP